MEAHADRLDVHEQIVERTMSVPDEDRAIVVTAEHLVTVVEYELRELIAERAARRLDHLAHHTCSLRGPVTCLRSSRYMIT